MIGVFSFFYSLQFRAGGGAMLDMVAVDIFNLAAACQGHGQFKLLLDQVQCQRHSLLTLCSINKKIKKP